MDKFPYFSVWKSCSKFVHAFQSRAIQQLTEIISLHSIQEVQVLKEGSEHSGTAISYLWLVIRQVLYKIFIVSDKPL
jgi:hypothetical protein